MFLLLACVDDPPESAATTDSADADTDADADSDADSDTDSDSDTDTDTDTTLPVDADGDGSPATEDCDDNDASVYPGAFDQCDAVDQDCDGEPFGPGACGEASVIEAGVDWVLTTSYVEVKRVMMTGDHTGDGLPDLLVTNSYYHAVFPGGALPEAPLLMVDDAWGAIDGSRYYGEWGDARYDAGDVDGDGVLDLSMLVTDDEPGMHLFLGPFAEGEVRAADAADMYIEATTVYEDLWGVYGIGPLDLDGDGRSDAVVNGNFDGGNSYDVFLGASHLCTANGGGGARQPRARWETSTETG